MSDSDRFFLRSGNLSWRRVGDEVVVLDLRETVCMTLNASGALLWEQLVNGATSSQLVANLTQHFAVDPSQAAVDVADFLARCRAEKMLA